MRARIAADGRRVGVDFRHDGSRDAIRISARRSGLRAARIRPYYRLPALPLIEALSDRRILIFLIVWFGLNVLFGLGSLSMTGAEQSVACWLAGAYRRISRAGLLLFGLFGCRFRDDRMTVERRPPDSKCDCTCSECCNCRIWNTAAMLGFDLEMRRSAGVTLLQ